MARMPLTKEEVVPTKLVLNVEKIGLTEEQFLQLCRDNRDLRMELTAQKELIIMSPTGLKSGWRELFLCTALMNWATKDGTGIAIDPYNARVYVYRPGHAVECLENPTTISADPVLSGFVFNAAEIW